MTERIASDTVQEASEQLSYSFYNHPRYVPPEEYEEATEIFLERIDDVPGVVSVYESGTGGISRPGISDVDLIVVVEDNIENHEEVRAGIEAAKTDEYYFFHGPEVLTQDMFAEYYNVLPMPKDLQLHYGESLPHDKNTDRYNYLAYLVDQVNTTYPMEFLDFLYFPGVSVSSHRLDIVASDVFDLLAPRFVADRFSVEVNTRFAIHRLNSLRNDMMLFVESTGRNAPIIEAFDDSITDLRERWLDLDRPDREALLIDRLQDSITATFAFVEHIHNHLGDIGAEVDVGETTYGAFETYHNVYRHDWSSGPAEQDTVEYCYAKRVKSTVLPQRVTLNDRLRDGDEAATAPDEYVDALQTRDETKARRDAAMETYKYHPLRAQYMSLMRRLFGLKARLLR